ncbi:GGDEF domain-containing protein [Dermatobacter hominis]|uniref:GGDEF domain-containing protein n=1 Tax=Dermatobacter hominis TaxID=2884263 RepID=UPI001D12AD61|nr:GGDEF domain-containing protein [Dermatobacter hominis]UDY37633.1 GGDEF domain-containing protein [Dermatobacter hominis]
MDRTRALPVEATVAMAALFAAGALLCIPTLAFHPWPEVRTAGVAFNFASAVATATVLYVGRHRVGSRVRAAVLVLGIFDVAFALYLGDGGPATALYSVLYVWIGVYLALEFATRQIVGYLALSAASGAAALAFVCEPAAAVTIGTTTVVSTAAATVVVAMLARRIKAMAAVDPLTGAANRRALADHISVLSARRHRRPVAVIVLDLDGFKHVNDRFGHAAGDSLLVDAAACWSAMLRPGDLLARSGGDEFVVVLDGCDEDRAVLVANRLARATPGPVTASVGIACSDSCESLELLMAAADQAAYRSKADGGAKVTMTAAR